MVDALPPEAVDLEQEGKVDVRVVAHAVVQDVVVSEAPEVSELEVKSEEVVVRDTTKVHSAHQPETKAEEVLVRDTDTTVVVQELEAKGEVSRSREAAGVQTTEMYSADQQGEQRRTYPGGTETETGQSYAGPGIKNILTDPVMRQVLIDFQENPRAVQDGSGARTQRRSGLGIVGFSDWRRGHSSPTDLCRHGLREPREGRVRTSTYRTTRHHGQRLSTPTTSMWS